MKAMVRAGTPRMGTARLVVCGLTAALVAGCQSPPAPIAEGANPTSQVTEVRQSTLAVPAGYNVQMVEFADASHGYAELVTAEPVTEPVATERYGSLLFATDDGGRTWRALADPRQPSQSPQMYTVDSRTVVLLAEPYGWYVSTDGGTSFGLRPSDPAPSELDALGGGSFRLDCEHACVVTRRAGSVSQPGLPGSIGALTEALGGAVWAASLDGDTARTAVSLDEGKSWRRLDVPAHPGGKPVRLSLQTSPDGRDVWLIGYLGGGVGGLGSVAPQRRKDIGMPVLWLLEEGRWTVKGTIGAPSPSLHPFSVAAIGGGFAAVQGPQTLFLVDDAWRAIELFPRTEWVTTLRDGTVFASAGTNRTYYLGTRTGSNVDWVQVVLALA